MYILGINAFHGDSSACILHNGELLMAVEEERFRRIKHWAGFPVEAIRACLEIANIGVEDLDYVTISKSPKANFVPRLVQSLRNIANPSFLKDKFRNIKKISSAKVLLSESFHVDIQKIKAQFLNIEHHRSHMASAFLVSPFQESALLSIDGFGDFSSTMIGFGKNNDIEVYNKVIFPHSLGIFYTALTQYLGFMNYGDEYKVMGLAALGKPEYVEKLNNLVTLTSDGLFRLNTKFFSHAKSGAAMTWEDGSPTIGILYTEELEKLLGKARKKDEELTDYHKNIAASVQKVSEIVLFHILNHLYERTHCENLCIAGGVAQNSVANGKLYLNTPFKNIYVPPAATDAGTCIGSAYYVYNSMLQNNRVKPMLSGGTGPSFSDQNIEELLKAKNITFVKLTETEVLDKVTDCLINAGVVGWFHGKSEFGPRALGFRSILADPRRSDAKEILNVKIKRRETFRPFAPSVLADHVKDYFETTEEVPFMEKVYVIKPEKRSSIPAVTHVDGTGRLQTVHKDVNPRYYSLIHKFFEKTGVPMLLNTSFNENEPIVNKPEEALNCYLRTNMDMLVLENYIISRI